MYIDPITRQTFKHATLICCDNYPQNVKYSDPDINEQYMTLKPVLRATTALFEPKQVESAVSPKTFTAE